MDKWKRALDEDVTGDLEERVLAKARPLLGENSRIYAQERAASRRRGWLFLAVPAAALVMALVVAFPRLRQEAELPADVAALPAGSELEIAMDFEMYRDLREIERLELLKELGDPEKWPKPKRAPKS